MLGHGPGVADGQGELPAVHRLQLLQRLGGQFRADALQQLPGLLARLRCLLGQAALTQGGLAASLATVEGGPTCAGRPGKWAPAAGACARWGHLIRHCHTVTEPMGHHKLPRCWGGVGVGAGRPGPNRAGVVRPPQRG